MKTAKEQAGHMAMQYDMNAHRTVFKYAFKIGVRWAQKWISVRDELPEEYTEVLVKCTNGKRIQFDVDFLFNSKTGKWQRRSNVTHWRPIEFK